MKHSRSIALASLLAFAGSTGCGYVLHPERRGNNGGEISGATLVEDILWFIPGILPGVIFLIVDFTSGAIYLRGGRYGAHVTPQGNLALNLADQKHATTLQLRVVTASHRVIDEQTVAVGPTVHDKSVELHIGATKEKVSLEIIDTAHPASALHQPLEVL